MQTTKQKSEKETKTKEKYMLTILKRGKLKKNLNHAKLGLCNIPIGIDRLKSNIVEAEKVQ